MHLTEFVNKWQNSRLTERSGAQQHFLDLCDLLRKPKPAEADLNGSRYTFEKSVFKSGGGRGFADVWLEKKFAWEYKGKKKDLVAAYDQLRQYEEALENPPLLVVCDFNEFEIHTRFNGMVKQLYAFDLKDLQANEKTDKCEIPPLEALKALWEDPYRLRPEKTTAQVTEDVAKEFATIASHLHHRKIEPHRAARFLIRLLFCLFAEDIGLLPDDLFSRVVASVRKQNQFDGPALAKAFAARLKSLFNAMAEGGLFGTEDIKYFNGGLFEDSDIIELNAYEIALLSFAAARDWKNIEPSIFGTLFERSLDPTKRGQLGAHYTSREDILAIVEPVLMAPLRKQWVEVKAAAETLKEKRDLIEAKQIPGVQLTGKDRRDIETVNTEISRTLRMFAEELGAVRVLDPACGSGNFLYVSLRCLLELNKEVLAFSAACGVPSLELHVQPGQMRGIEKNEYAHELAPVTIQIGYIQWLRDSGMGEPLQPILQKMQQVVEQDAILGFDADGKSFEPVWPEADVIVGNPPFLGDKKMRAELGDGYVKALRKLYEGRVPGGADLVCYWFEHARHLIEQGKVQRAGLIATNSIRNGASRKVLERIKQSGDIFMAWSDRAWNLDGAAVRTSIVGFSKEKATAPTLNDVAVGSVNFDLSSDLNVAEAKPLSENAGIVFLGVMKAGPFDIDGTTARHLLAEPVNSHGRPNSDVVKLRLGGQEVTGRGRDVWIIDFGVDMTEEEAAKYHKPFEYIRRNVKPLRDLNNRERMKRLWWLHGEPRPGLRRAIANKSRCIVTPEVSKHRVFVWMPTETVPDHKLHVFARDDDYFFGVLHSRAHEIWSLTLGSTLEDRPSYASSATFGTFPMPWRPGTEPDECENQSIKDIADAARVLVRLRDEWLNPPDATPTELRRRTLTNLYNERPDWLIFAHARLDEAVIGAYGWPTCLSEADLLTRLLALNHERAATDRKTAVKGTVETKERDQQ